MAQGEPGAEAGPLVDDGDVYATRTHATLNAWVECSIGRWLGRPHGRPG